MGKKKIAEAGAGLLDDVIRLWHGSPSDFDKFDSDYIGTGEGAQAFGYGHYGAEAKGTAEYYKEALSEPRILLSNKPLGAVYTADIRDSFKAFYDQIADEQIERYADMFADAADSAGYGDGDAYDAAYDYMEANFRQLFKGEGDKAIDDASFNATLKIKKEYPELSDMIDDMFYDLEGTVNDIDGVISNIGQAQTQGDFDYVVNNYLSPSQKNMFEEYFSHNIKFDQPDSKLYEIGVKGRPEEFLDWDKPISQQSDTIKQRLGVVGDLDEVASLQARKAQLQSEYKSIQKPFNDENDFDALFGSIDPREGPILQEIQLIDSRINDLTTPKDLRIGNSFIPSRMHDEYAGRHIIEGNNKSPELSGLLSQLGIKGVRYNDAVSRAPDGGRGTSNYVIFNDDDIEILNKYLRPETFIGTGLTGLGAGALATGSDRAMANPVDDLRTSEAQWDMTPEERAIADLRASEASFGDQGLADAYTGASTLWDNVGTSLKNAGLPAGLVDIMQPTYESSAAKAAGDNSAMTGLFAMLEKLDPVAYAGLLGSEYLKRNK
jgi:hypothetical protein